jgi:predicted Fe-Mo cluster-binding NifX family protein
MRIAVASQNRKTVTGHAGKCRKYWLYQITGKEITSRELLELPIEQSFHESNHDQPHPLDAVDVLICGGMGQGLQHRLKQKGILAVATSETDLERAVAGWLNGTLPEAAPEDHAHGHEHDHGHKHLHHAQTTVVELKLPT